MVMPQDAAGSRASTIKETFGLECRFRAFRLREDVATKTCVPSNQYHTATMWMEPSGFSVASDAIFRPSNNCLTRTSAREAIIKSPLLPWYRGLLEHLNDKPRPGTMIHNFTSSKTSRAQRWIDHGQTTLC